MRARRALPARLEREVLASFGRASVSSSWWKAALKDVRHCLRCGGTLAVRFVPEEGCRRRVCGGCGSIAYQNPKIVAGTLPLGYGRVWLLRRDIEPSRGLWTFPAGYMELGETLEAAAARETREEILCRARITALHGIYSYMDAGVVTVVFRARVSGPRPRAGREAQCVRAFRPSEVPWRELAFRSVFHALRDWVIDKPGFVC